MDLLNELKMIDAEELIIAMASIVEENRRLRNKLNIFENIKNRETNDILKEHIRYLELPSSIHNSLCRNGIFTIAKLCDMTYSEMINVKGLGDVGLRKLINIMNMYGLHFADEVIK